MQNTPNLKNVSKEIKNEPMINFQGNWRVTKTIHCVKDYVGEEMTNPVGLAINTNNNHVYVAATEGILEFDETGTFIKKCRIYYKPSQIIYTDCKVIATYKTKNADGIHVYDDELNLIRTFAHAVINQYGVGHIDCDDKGRIFIPNLHCNPKCIEMYSIDGYYMGKFCLLDESTEVCHVFVTQCGDILLNKFKKIQTTTVSLSYGYLEAEFTEDHHIAIHNSDGQEYWNSIREGNLNIAEGYQDNNGYIYVADERNDKIEVYNADLEHHATVNDPAKIFGNLSSVAITTTGTLIVADSAGNKVHYIVE